MALSQSIGPQRLERTPEPDALTDAPENVLEYDRVMTTKLAIAYMGAVEVLHRVRPEAVEPGAAVDLACGPGHFTLCLARYLEYGSVTGVDLAPRMVRTATANAERHGLAEQVRFQEGNVTGLTDIPDQSVDLASFTGAAHHLPGLDAVGATLREMERVARPDGLLFVMDLVRLRTRKLTEYYVRTLGGDYLERGLTHFYEDFRNSMYASYTPAEFAGVVPKDTRRRWVHLVPRFLPTIQILVGLPEGRERLLLRPGFPKGENPLLREWRERWEREVSGAWARETAGDCRMFRLALSTAARVRLGSTSKERS